MEYERLWRSAATDTAEPAQRQLYLASQPAPDDPAPPSPAFSPPFDSVLSLTLQPHVDVAAHVGALGVDLPESEAEWLSRKEATAQRFAASRPDLAGTLALVDLDEAAVQRQALDSRQQDFLRRCAERLEALPHWDARAIQDALFESARDVGIDPRAQAAVAFGALYRVFLGAETGPRAGSYLAFLGRQEVLQRLR